MAGSNLVAVIQSLQQQVVQLTEKVNQLSAQTDRAMPASDPTSAAGASRQNLGNSCNIKYGRVAEVLPYFGWYRVVPDGGGVPLACSLGTDVSMTPIGVRRIGALQPNARVYFVQPNNCQYGTIFAVDPSPVTSGRQSISDYVSQASRNSPASEPTTQAVLQQKKHGVIDYSNGRPLDETAVGEWGYIADTGVAVFVDSFMSFLRSDENCGFWAFYHDQKARIQGHNLEVRSAGREDIHQDDIAEFTQVVGSTPYPREAIGAVDPAATVFTDRTLQQSQIASPEWANVDLADSHQTSFFRTFEYGGYLGQGSRRSIVLPPANVSLLVMGDTTPRPGVFDEQIGLNGDYLLRSAAGLTIAHVPPFAVPIRVKLADDRNGDTQDNYRAGGFGTVGAPHIITAEIPVTGDNQRMIRSLAIDDDLVYSTQWRGDHPFYYHTKDFKVHEPSDIPSGSESPPGYGVLSSSWFLPDDNPAEIKVDHRFNAKLHQLLSMIKFLPDGGIVLTAGGGEELRLAGGSADLAAPGDVNIRPGRNAWIKAGRDAIVQGHGSVEITASTERIWIKSEQDLNLLAGNSGSGALLLQSKSASIDENYANNVGTDVQSGGVIIKSDGLVTLLGDELYLRSGAKTGNGLITLDSAKGLGQISLVASAVSDFVSTAHVIWFGSNGSYTKGAEFSASGAILPGSLEIDGSVVLTGGLIVGTNIAVANGHIATSEAQEFNFFVAPLKDKSLKEAQDDVAQVSSDESKLAGQGASTWNGSVSSPFYGANRVGNDTTIQQVSFSYRTTAQARCDKFLLFESRWQQRQRLTGSGATTWSEKPVIAGSTTTYPWPGKDAWTGTSYRTVDLTLYSVTTGTPAPRGATYEALTPVTSVSTVADGNYPIIG